MAWPRRACGILPATCSASPWARAPTLPAEQRQTLIETALHESTHLVASIAVNAGCAGVCIRPRANRYGMLGWAHCGLALYVEEEAFCDAAGLAWEELHGDIRTAQHDADTGRARIGARARWTHILNRARDFVVVQEPAICTCATGLLNVLPTSYEVSTTKRNKLLKWIASQMPRVQLATLQGEAPGDVGPCHLLEPARVP